MSLHESLTRNTETIIGAEELGERIQSGKKLRVKLGVDPTRPDLTFGHMVVLNKLRAFQDHGHDAVLIIGDYTAQIGDPSGRSALRPVLSPGEVRENADTYLKQAFLILDEDRTEVHFNSEWFNEMDFGDCLNLARKMTVARMLERDDFDKRYRENTPISIVEFLYPLIQGYDSVMLKSDVEIGGSDQLFNMLVGRALQKDAGQPEQAVFTMPLLIGLDGTRKMSKSLDNYVAFTDSPQEMFGKVMSIPDETMWIYYRLLLEMDEATITRHQEKDHPMEAKKQLAASLVSLFHNMDEARKARAGFEQVFSQGQNPDEMPSFGWEKLAGAPQATAVDLMAATGLFQSKKELRRLFAQGGVKINEQREDEPTRILTRPEEPLVIQVGKRTFFRVEP